MVVTSGKYFWMTALLICLLAMPAFAGTYEEIFSDDFDSYPAGTLLSSGDVDGWTVPTDGLDQPFNGSGDANQKVVDSQFVSSSNSLQLEGFVSWASNAYRATEIPTMVRLAGKIRIDKDSTCSQDPKMTRILALMGLYNPAVETWGQEYGEVQFNCDNKIYAVKKHISDSSYEYAELMSYSRDTWYSVVLDINLKAKVYSVSINGKVIKEGIGFVADSGSKPTGIRLGAIHGGDQSSSPKGYPLAWFDDISLSGYDPAPWTMFLVPVTRERQ